MTDIDNEMLQKVEKVNELVSKLACSNDESVIKETEEYLSKIEKPTTFNKTLINKSNTNNSINDQEAFMKSIEKDAAERTERRRIAKSKAEIIKNKANDYFSVCDYERALQLYSEAIDICRDFDVLYTNRAQAYLKLEKYEDALKDCESAIFLNKENHKAYLHQGKSLVKLNRFDEGLESYNKVLELKPNLKKYVADYINEANTIKQNVTKNNHIYNESGDNSFKNLELSEVISALTKQNHAVEYYTGGLQLIDIQLRSDKKLAQALYTDLISNLSLFSSDSQVIIMINNILKNFVKNNSKEWDLLATWISVLVSIIQNLNEEEVNETQLLSVFKNETIQCIIQLICSKSSTITKSKLPISISDQLIQLLYYFSRKCSLIILEILDKCSINQLCSLLLICLESKENLTRTIALSLLLQWIDVEKFKVKVLREEDCMSNLLNGLQGVFQNSLINYNNNNQHLKLVIKINTNLADNAQIRQKIFRHEKIIPSVLDAIESRIGLLDDEKYVDVVLKLVEYIHELFIKYNQNSSNQSIISDRYKSFGLRIAKLAHPLLTMKLGATNTRIMRNLMIVLLSVTLHLLTDEQLLEWCEEISKPTSSESQSTPVTTENSTRKTSLVRSLSVEPLESPSEIRFFATVRETLKLVLAIVLEAPSHPLLSPAIKILTQTTRVSHAVRCLCCDKRNRALKLAALIDKDENGKLDEVIVGNTCLLLSQCVEETPVAEHLANYTNNPNSNNNIIMRLLRTCQDANNAGCRRNAAILAGKLATSLHVHRTEMSRLDGFSILSKFGNWNVPGAMNRMSNGV